MHLTPLCESKSGSFSCFLLEVDACRILLDCGWSEPYDVDSLEPLREVAPSLDIVLLSHSDTSHLGALPYAVSKLGLKSKVLCTLPVSKMGQMFLYDAVLSLQAESNFNIITLDEIDSAFSQVTPLKYNEEYLVKDHGLIISAKSSGHMVGGAVWVISKEMQNIVYAVDFNHRREKHLNGMLFDSFRKPALLITESKHIFQNSIQDEEQTVSFLNSMAQVLRKGGKVLIPTDTAGRLLELVLLLEEYWLKNKLLFPLILLGSVAYSTINFASCQLEWMHSSIAAAFEKDRDNPFDCRCVQFCNGLEDLEKMGDGPKVVLASTPSLETGFAKPLAVEWIQDKNNLIVFTQEPQEGTLGSTLANAKNASDPIISVSLSHRVPLSGKELEDYELEKLRKSTEMNVLAEPMDEENLTESEMIDAAGFGGDRRASSITRGLSIEEGADDFENKHCFMNGTLLGGFKPSEAAEFPMFPFDHKQESDWDVYGETCNESDIFHLQSTKEDQSLLSGAPLILDEEVPEIPTKIVTEEMKIQANGSIALYDFSARTNAHFLRHFISHIRPRNLILINGSTETHEAMSEIAKTSCHFLKETGRIQCPKQGERVEFKDQLGCFKVTMDDTLLEQLDWKESSAARVAWVDGRLETNSNSKESLQMLALDSQMEKASLPDALFVGECRLSAIKRKVESLGLKAMFQEGKLTCNGAVQIQITSQSTISIEGPLSTDYYLIREAIDDIYRLR